MKDIAVVGSSLAGTSAARALREQGFEGSITLVGDEPHRPYDRPPLSKEILVGTKAVDDIALRDLDDLDLAWSLGNRATGLDIDRRMLMTAEGELHVDGLVIATGVRSRIVRGLEPDGQRLFTLRHLDEALALRRALGPGARVLIVGNGFIGVEVATSARTLGCEVTVVGRLEPLAHAGPLVSATCARILTREGITSLTGLGVVSADRDRRVAQLDDGRSLEFDVMIVAAGSVPNVEWIAESGLPIEDGVSCTERCGVVGFDWIAAAGDIARWPNPAFGGRSMRIEHWANAIEQGQAAARALLRGDEAPAFSSLPSFWSDHCGVRLQSVGMPSLGDRLEFTDGGAADDRYAVSSYLDGRLVGGQAYGNPRAMAMVRVEMSRVMKEEAA